jgi:PAS domain S-box-containing protein
MVKSVSEISTKTIVDLRATPKQITRVLHVDDDLSFLKVARSCLEMQGSFEVDTVSSVEEALRKLGEEEYDAVISDYQMPGKDGLEFLKELRQKDNAIPFIVFTGKGKEEIAIRALNLGADQYVDKTGEPETVYFELAHAICKAVEHKHAEEALRESEEKFRTIAQRSFDMILTLNSEGEITYVSQAAETVGGYEPQEIIGKPFSRFLHESEITDAGALLQRVLAGEETKSWELTFLKKDRTAATLEVNAFPVIKDGKIVEIRATARDITERKKYEAELRRLASFPERNPNPVLEIDLTGKITYLNPPARKLLSQLRDSKLPNGLEEDFKAIISEFNVHRRESFLRENAKIGERYYQQTIHYVPEKAVLRLYMLDITERENAKEQMSKTSDEFGRTFDAIVDFVFIVDSDYRLVRVCRNICDLLKKKPEDLVGKHCYEVIHGTDKPWLNCPHRKTLETRKPASAEIDDHHLGMPLLVTVSPIYEEKGEFVQCVHTFKDITESKKVEEQLRKSEKKYRELFETSIDAIATSDISGHFVDCNQSCLKMLGYTLEEMKKLTYQQLTPEKWREKEAEIIEKEVLQKGYTAEHEKELVRKDGSVIPVSNRVWATFDENGKPKAMWCIVRDITERKKTEQTLRASLERYRSFIGVTGELGWTTNSEGEVVEDIPSFRKFTGQNYDAVKGWGWSKAIHPDDLERTTKIWKEATRTKSKYETEYRLRRHDGIYRYFIARSVPVLKEDGSIGEWVGACIDITKRKEMEEELLKQKIKAEQYLNIVGNIVVALDCNGKITLLNKKGYNILGYGEGELVGKDWFETCLPKENKEEVKKVFEACIQGKLELVEQSENPILTKNGERRAVSWYNTVLKDDNGKIIGTLSSGEEITERRRTEEALRKSAEQARSLLEFQNKVIDTAVVWINILDRDGNVNLWNRAAELISGYSREEVIGHRKIWGWLYPDPSYCAKTFAQAKRTIDHQESTMQNFETVIRCKNGALKTIAWYANSITGKKRKPIGSIAVGLDVSQLRKAEEELRQAMERLHVMNEKLRVVGGLTRHDVRNKLAAITGNTYLAKKKLPENSEVLDYMKQIEACVGQTVRILEFARAYEMLGVEELAYIDLEKAVDEAISLFSGLKDVKITNDCHGLTVLADSLLVTLFYNLIDNSVKYGEKLTRIRVYCKQKNSGCLNVIYGDDGVGIPQAVKPKLFAEGYTTGKGSGYGLYLIKKMIDAYGWTVEEIGKPGKGARFVISIPKTNSKGKGNYQVLAQ